MEFEIRKQRGPSRGETLHREQRAYFDLVNKGVSSHEACRIVGINYRTGKRWRNGHKPSGGHPGAPPVATSALHTESGRYLGTTYPYRRPAPGRVLAATDRRRVESEPLDDQPGDPSEQ